MTAIEVTARLRGALFTIGIQLVEGLIDRRRGAVPAGMCLRVRYEEGEEQADQNKDQALTHGIHCDSSLIIIFLRFHYPGSQSQR